MNQFVGLTLRTVPWTAGGFSLLAAIGWLQGDLKLSSIRWLPLVFTFPLIVIAVSAASAGLAFIRERKLRAKHDSNPPPS